MRVLRHIAEWSWATERGFRFTLAGYLHLLMITSLGAAALNTEANLLLLVFGLGVGATGTAALMTAIGLGRTTVDRSIPSVATAGQPFAIRYRLTNRRRWRRAFSVSVADPVGEHLSVGTAAAYFPVVGPGMSASVEVSVAAKRRGRLVFDRIRLATQFPLSLFVRNRHQTVPGQVVVYPAPGRLRRPIWNHRPHRDASDAGRHRAARGMGEFHGVREYRYGDSPRWIHWRRSARTGQLFVRETAEPRVAQGVVVLDTHIVSAVQDAQREQAVRLAATACCAGLDSGFQIGLIAAAEPILVVPPAGGGAQRERLMGALALLSGEGIGFDEALRCVHWPTGWRGLSCVFVAAIEDDRTQAVAKLLTRHGADVTVFVAGTAFAADVFDDVGAARLSRPIAS